MKNKEIISELIEISKRIDHFMGCINHGVSWHDNKAIQDWNNGNFGIKPLIKKINDVNQICSFTENCKDKVHKCPYVEASNHCDCHCWHGDMEK